MKQRFVIVPAAVVELLEAGGRDVPGRLLGAWREEPGRVMSLLNLQGQPLGLGVADPENGLLRVFAAGAEQVQALDQGFFNQRVEAALSKRRALGLDPEQTTFRAFHGAADGLPGLAADLLGEFAVVYSYAQGLVPQARLAARALRDRAGLRGVVLKVRSRGAASQHRLIQETFGEEPPEKLIARESGVPFELHLVGGLNYGLFTDMRESRLRFAKLVAGRDVLNGFSYTGAFSVVAARSGAKSVTSVDLSAGVQRWPQDNFRLSGLDPELPQHRFEVDDVGRYLERAEAEGLRFDLVLLDPPTFSEARGAPWSLDRDYPRLMETAARLLRPGGLLWLSTNTRAFALEQRARQAIASAKREAQLIEAAGLPADYPTLPAQPDDAYLQARVFELA